MALDCALDETNRGTRNDVDRRVLLRSDGSGLWTLSGVGSGARQFPDFEAALDVARQDPGARQATIEVWQGSQYICCLPASAWRPHGGSIRSAPARPQGRRLTAAERSAHRAAETLFTTTGPLFWLALVVVAVSVSLGWRLLFL
jgi:hypothetical protein